MNLLNRLNSARLAFTGQVSKITAPEVENKIKEKKSKTYANVPNHRQVFRTSQDILTLENAITEAESTTYNRQYLHEIYRQVVLEDPHVCSQWENRKMKTLKKSWGIFVGDSNEKDDTLTDIFDKPWFYDLIRKILDAKAWGFSCIELASWDAQNQRFAPYRADNKMIYDAVQVINRDYVKPEFGTIVTEPHQTEGIDIYKYPNQLLMVGGKDHGFLYKLAKPCLFKQNAIVNWSEWIEVFGLDTIALFTEAEESEKVKALEALKSLGTNRMGAFALDDRIEAKGSQKTDAYKVFEQMGRYVDESISKIIFGQDVISNNTGQVVGNVGENVANDYAATDCKDVVTVVNDVVIPMMTRRGLINGQNAYMKYDESLSMREMKERADIDLLVTQMGFKHDVDQINERYGVNVETTGTSSMDEVRNKLKNLYPHGKV